MIGIQLKDGDLEIKVERDSSGKILSGLALGDILCQNQALILQLHKGELHEDPSVGVGISDILLDNDFQMWKREIREQMELDGQKVSSVKIDSENILIDSKY